MRFLFRDSLTTKPIERFDYSFPKNFQQDEYSNFELEDEKKNRDRRRKAIVEIKNRISKDNFTDKENAAKSIQSESLTNFIALKKLEGQVTSIDQEQKEVSIRFHEIGGDNQVIEEAVFDMDEIPPSDYDLLEEGAIVYWNIGYLDQSGERKRISELRFRRMPIWSKREIERVEKKAKAFKDFFSPEPQNKKSND